MYYITVQWRHNALDYPIEIWSELDANRFETRKMERYGTGTWKCWDTARPDGLGTVPVPALATIQEEEEFTALEIDCAIFEQLWKSVCPAEN